MNRVLKLLVLTPLVIASAILLAWYGVIGVGSLDRLAPADLGVVLGTWTYADTRPSDGLVARLDRGIEVYRAGYVPRLMVTGGTDWYGGNEALVMRRYLLERGIPDTAIVVDTLGVDTWRNALHSRDWLAARGLKRAMIVTQAFHVVRARIAFARVGGMELSWTHPRFREGRDWHSLVRELAGFFKYTFGPVPEPLAPAGQGAGSYP